MAKRGDKKRGNHEARQRGRARYGISAGDAAAMRAVTVYLRILADTDDGSTLWDSPVEI